MNNGIVPQEKCRSIKPAIYTGTAVPMKARAIKEKGIFPGLYMRSPWVDVDTGCECGRGIALPEIHARWCQVRNHRTAIQR